MDKNHQKETQIDNKYDVKPTKKQDSNAVSAILGQQLEYYLEPLLKDLDKRIDKRLVRTFLRLVFVIIQFRHSQHGLVLSELGAYLLSPDQAPAGTKRISNLLRCSKWHFGLIERFLWRQGDACIDMLEAEGKDALCLWDESVIEKPESIAIEGLCAVRSSVSRRLRRIKPGFFNPPIRPTFVPGLNWVAIMVTGLKTQPTMVSMRWWTTRGPLASSKRIQEKKLLLICLRRWGQRVIHVWDRGFVGRPWLALVVSSHTRFVMRWQPKYHLVGPKGQMNAWKIVRGKRSWQYHQIWDARRCCYRKTGIIACQVTHPKLPNTPLWMVVSRPGQGRKPWYLLTSEPIHSVDDAWRIVFIYARRWQIEMTFRFTKSELAFESPRLWFWQNRLKLLLIATLAYAFLLFLILLPASWQQWLFRFWCHRTGKRYRDVSIPLYRLRIALSRLWLDYPPPLSFSW